MEEVEDHFIMDHFFWLPANSSILSNLTNSNIQTHEAVRLYIGVYFKEVIYLVTFLGPFPACEDMLDPISIFIHSLGRCLGKYPKMSILNILFLIFECN